MKLVLFDDYIPGALVDGGVVDLSDAAGRDIMALPGEARMPAIIARWDEIGARLESASRQNAPLEKMPRLRAPLPRPGKLPFASGNFNEGFEGPTFPIDFFFKAPSTILDPGEEVQFPEHDAQLFFHEAELGVVIGKRAKNVAAADAMDHVFGYTCVNDFSSTGLPGVIGGVRSKSFDTFCPVGPCIVTKDEIPDPHKLQIRLWVDDVLRQDYNTDDMEHQVPALIEWLAAILTLEPGDLLACGTNHHGIGPIQHGEVMRLEIDGIGSFSNGVNDPQRRRWPKGPDEGLSDWVKEYKTTGGKVTRPPFLVKRIG